MTDKFRSQSTTGAQRVAAELLEGLSKSTEVTLLKSPHNGLLGHLYEQFIIPFQIPKNGTLISPLNIGPLFHKNQIVIIHDIASIEHPEWFNRKFRFFYKYITPILVKRVKSIVTVSQYTKERLIIKYGIPPNKITVIQNGVDFEFFNSESQSLIIEEHNLEPNKYLLSVCSIEPRKNIERLIDAWIQSDLYSNGYKLVFAGSAGSNFATVSKYQSSSIVWLGYVDDCDLPVLYQNAKAFVYVSLYEGFGLPPLEAMCAGLPVLASNTTSIPEVMGNCGILVNPYKVEDITAGLIEIITRPKSSQYSERAKIFSWKKFTDDFLNLIQKLNKRKH